MRNVLITGASRGIGAETARLFASKGDNVVINYNNSEAEAKKIASEIGATALRADVSNPDEVKKMFEAAGEIDVLVNNAGISGFYMLDAMSDDDWKKMIDTNLSSAFYCSRAVLPRMISKKRGAIINVSSMWGINGAACEVAYSAAKAGLIGMTKALAKEVGPSGIRVNCVAPGIVDTDMNKEIDDKTLAELREETPLCRIGKPTDIAKAIYFLADEESFITGHILNVSGGFVV